MGVGWVACLFKGLKEWLGKRFMTFISHLFLREGVKVYAMLADVACYLVWSNCAMSKKTLKSVTLAELVAMGNPLVPEVNPIQSVTEVVESVIPPKNKGGRKKADKPDPSRIVEKLGRVKTDKPIPVATPNIVKEGSASQSILDKLAKIKRDAETKYAWKGKDILDYPGFAESIADEKGKPMFDRGKILYSDAQPTNKGEACIFMTLDPSFLKKHCEGVAMKQLHDALRIEETALGVWYGGATLSSPAGWKCKQANDYKLQSFMVSLVFQLEG